MKTVLRTNLLRVSGTLLFAISIARAADPLDNCAPRYVGRSFMRDVAYGPARL